MTSYRKEVLEPVDDGSWQGAPADSARRRVDASDADVDRGWRAFLRRFDIEHTFRLFKQNLGWVVAQLRNPDSAAGGPGW